MKRALLLSSIAVMCLFSSCKEDKCETVSCQNGGTCVEGTCNCPTGYSGANCEIAPDPCENVTCVNGTTTSTTTTCTCNCETGYEGTTCNTEERAKFLTSDVTFSETCSGTAFSYLVSVTAAANVEQIRIKNLGGYNCSSGDYYVVATVNGTNFTIVSQVVCATTFAGSGSLSGSTLTITYTATYDNGSGNTTDSCNGTLTL
jgi:hypothetical protein